MPNKLATLSGTLLPPLHSGHKLNVPKSSATLFCSKVKKKILEILTVHNAFPPPYGVYFLFLLYTLVKLYLPKFTIRNKIKEIYIRTPSFKYNISDNLIKKNHY